MPDRPIIKTIPVQPGLNVVVEDSHNILLQLTTLSCRSCSGAHEVARTNAITNIDRLVEALDAARLWVHVTENPEALPAEQQPAWITVAEQLRDADR